MKNQNLVQETKLLNFSHPALQTLIRDRQWLKLEPYERIQSAYDFVRNHITFGYNISDNISASDVLIDGYGQCNTKATLLMALLRALNIPCKLHGFTIFKKLQRGVVPELVYGLAPERILHSWVEIFYQEKWLKLEGFILDQSYLLALQKGFEGKQSLCAFGVGTDALSSPPIEWQGQDTFIQATGIAEDLGLWDDPDAFYKKHQQDFGYKKDTLYRFIIRHWMNVRVKKIRLGKIPSFPGTHPKGSTNIVKYSSETAFRKIKLGKHHDH